MAVALITMVATVLAMPGAASADAASGSPPTTAVGMLVGPTVAMTSETQSVQTFRNENTGWCLDDSVEFGLRTYGCNYGPHQQWNVRAWADGTRQLRNVATGGASSIPDRSG
ncbi:MAG: RICIN domain-containing protein [Pseudonocardiaceae bacterium]